MTRRSTYKRFCSACGAWRVCNTWVRCPAHLLRFEAPSKCGKKAWWCRKGDCGTSGRIESTEISTTVSCRTRSNIRHKFCRRGVEKASAFVALVNRQVVLQKQMRAAVHRMKDLLRVHSQCVSRRNALRKSERDLKKQLREQSAELVRKRVRIAQLVKSPSGWRARAQTRNRQIRVLERRSRRIQKPELKVGGRYRAWVPQLYYELYNLRVSEHMANVITGVANALGIELGSLPSKRTRGRLRLEGGCWDEICAATALTDAKVEDQADGKVFTMCEGRDTTSANGWHVQVHSTHVTTNSGRISVVNDAPLVHNKTAATQAAHTQQVRSTIDTLSQGDVRRDVEVHSKISDSANNETATNRLEGIRSSVPCVGHCVQNTAYHGSTPDKRKHAFVTCLCGSKWPPGGGGDGPVLWAFGDLCGASIHAECFHLDSAPEQWVYHMCIKQGLETDDIVFFQ